MTTHQSRRHYGAALVATALVVVGLPLAATSASALLDPNVGPSAPHSITTFPARDFVNIAGYASSDVLTVEVWRGGFKVGTTLPFSPSIADPKAPGTFMEDVNHLGEPCWSGVTPDIRGDDVVKVLTSATTGDQAPIANVTVTSPVAETALNSGTVVMTGTAVNAAGGQIPIAQVEARIVANKQLFSNGRRTLRTGVKGDGILVYDSPTATTWTATFTGLNTIAPDGVRDADKAVKQSESRGMWLGRNPGAFNETTIHEFGATGGPAAGCTAPLAKGPSVPVMTAATDTGVSASDSITRIASPTFVGVAGLATATSVNLYVDGVVNGTATVVAGGYSLTPATPLADGIHTITAGETSPGSPETLSTGSLPVTIDTVAPVAPAVTGTSPASQGGSVTPSVKGTAEAGSMVSVYTDPACGPPAVVSGSAASFTSPGVSAPVAAGSSASFFATATDVAGNVSTCSTTSARYAVVAFTGTAPTRVLDTRVPIGAPTAAKLGAGATMTLAVPGLPAGATAVALNVTVTNPTADSYLSVYPGGSGQPNASNLNYVAGQTIPNMVVVPLGPGNTVTLFNAAGTVHLIADLVGYYAPGTGAGFTGTGPLRVLDTRIGTGAPTAPLGAGATMTLTVPGLPAGATAVAMNVTVTNPTTASYLSVYPGGSAQPNASNLNYVAGQTIPNMVIVPLGPGNTVTLFNAAGTVDVIADLVGSYAPGTGAGFTGTTPTRVLDTRVPIGAPTAAKLGAGATMTLTVPNLPAGATAVALNVTVTNPSAGSYLSVYPGGSAQPNASNLNYVAGETIPNMVIVPVGPGGTVTLFNAAGLVHVIADLVGYYN
ncbi:Ig-like domain-containing protein [Lapillicoccus sp.]|uniref:Ig-like domain-containing protein n=1 Tax=Lapillicoccus sp. TaxID=1909287 RepID=UPI0039831B7A